MGVRVKRCRRCKSTENLYPDKRTYICRTCNTAKNKKYRQTKKGKLIARRAVAKYEKNNPSRRTAWSKAQAIPLKPCEVCGDSEAHRHHPDISKPLEVIFLCPAHHKEAHKKVPV